MKITHLYSASELVEDRGVKILFDPWLTGREFGGSWAMYPPYDFKPEKFDDVDFIWISHLHSDHFSKDTLSKLNKDIPVLIHNFPRKGLKMSIEKLGFTVTELDHNCRTRLKDDLHINVLAADDCDPEICGRWIGCSVPDKSMGTLQVDTMCVIDNGDKVLMNLCDSSLPLTRNACSKIKQQYQNIDFLLMTYVTAISYPHCYEYSVDEMLEHADKKMNTRFEMIKQYLDNLKPKYYMPFAGTYTLCGKNSNLNKYRGEPELDVAAKWFKNRIPDHPSKMILLNADCTFDMDTEKQSQPFIPIDGNAKQKYIDDVLSKLQFDYENESFPEKENIVKLLPKCYESFEKARKKFNWSSDIKIVFSLNDNEFVSVSCDGEGYKIISTDQANKIRPVLMMRLDQRLLYWILQGPRKSHWTIADLGSHIRYRRIPDQFNRGLYFCLREFYSNIYN